MCRSFLAPYKNEGYLGRNNIGVVTVNLVRCALAASGTDEFWDNLDKAVSLAKEGIDCRIDDVRKIKAKSAPILYMHGAFGLRTTDPEELVFDRFFSNCRASVSLGYIGLHEVCLALFGKGQHESPESKEFAVSIVAKLKSYVDEWKATENLGYSLYSLPGNL